MFDSTETLNITFVSSDFYSKAAKKRETERERKQRSESNKENTDTHRERNPFSCSSCCSFVFFFFFCWTTKERKFSTQKFKAAAAILRRDTFH